jgi:hypothetical protein
MSVDTAVLGMNLWGAVWLLNVNLRLYTKAWLAVAVLAVWVVVYAVRLWREANHP